LTAPDEEFVRYITDKQSRCDEGEDMNHEYLMVLAGNKYKGRVEAGTWNAPNKDQVKLLALAAELAEVKKLIPKGTTTKASTGGGTGSGKGTKGPFQRAEWQMVKPTALEIANKYTKKVNGKEFKWCAKHAMWCGHSTAECRKGNAVTNDATKTDANKNGDGDDEKSDDQKTKLAVAYQAVSENSGADDE
jgi:hypothetical protein